MFKKFIKSLYCICVFFIFYTQYAISASREAVVSVSATVIYSKPNTRSPIVKELKQGDKVRIGQKIIRGWVKGVALSSGKRASKVGYILMKDLSAHRKSEEPIKKDKITNEIKDEAKRMYAGLYIPFTFHSLEPLEKYLLLSDAGISKLSMGFAGEFGYKLVGSLWGQARLEYLSVSQKFDASVTGGSSDASYSFSSILFSVAPEFQMNVSDFLSFDGSLGLGAFIGTQVALSGVGLSANAMNITPVFAVIPRIGVRINMFSFLGLGIGGGYRLALESESDNLSSLGYLGLSAPFFDIGLRASF